MLYYRSDANVRCVVEVVVAVLHRRIAVVGPHHAPPVTSHASTERHPAASCRAVTHRPISPPARAATTRRPTLPLLYPAPCVGLISQPDIRAFTGHCSQDTVRLSMMTTSMHTGGLNTETAMVLSQSMDSVNTSPDEEVGVAVLFSHNKLPMAMLFRRRAA